MVTERDTPAKQCTNTAEPFVRASSGYKIWKQSATSFAMFVCAQLTDKSNGIWEMYGQVLGPMVSDGYLKILDVAGFFEHIWKIRCNI